VQAAKGVRQRKKNVGRRHKGPSKKRKKKRLTQRESKQLAVQLGVYKRDDGAKSRRKNSPLLRTKGNKKPRK